MGEGDTSLLHRAREVLASLREPKSEQASPSRPETVARQVAESLARWQGSASVRRFLGVPNGHDQLGVVDEPVWLLARVGPVLQRGAAGIRFWLGEQPLGTCSLTESGADGVGIRVGVPGVHTIQLQPIGSNDASLGPAGVAGEVRLHVVSSAPVVGVDASLLLEPGSDSPEAVRRLAQDGVQVFYFDLDRTDRAAEIHTMIAALGLPDGALLTHPGSGEDIEPGSTDFSQVFRLTTVRRLRANGVPVVASLGAHASADASQAVAVLRPSDVTTEALAQMHEHARDFAARRAQTDPLTWRLDEATNTRLLPGNAMSVEFDNRLARERLFALIEGATRSIHLQTYIFREGQVANALVVRLVQRARAGVKVRVIVDALYSGEQVLGRKNPLLESLSLEDNIEVVVGSPIEFGKSFDSVSLKQRDHRKLLVVDGRTGFVTGRNISDPYYLGFDETPIHHHTAHEHIPWLDAHVEASGPIVDALDATFASAWAGYGGAEHANLTPPPSPQVGSCCARLVVHNGLLDANGMLQYEAMLDGARKHVYIVNDFPIVPSLASAMLRALARGVRLVLLTGNAVARRADGSFFPGPVYRELFDHMVKQRLEPLIRSGAEVFEYVAPTHSMIVPQGGVVRPYVHAKVMSCDGRAASIGSANLDVTASYWEHEANVVVQDDSFAQDLERQIESMLERAYAIDLESEYWRRDRAKRAIVAKLWPSVVYS